ncbi:YHYH domain-containing protein [Emergencia sp.]|uniref:YHYH domain-containing protein n=1 Tax=Emergencia sp. TaxID=1926557 RepID=UPI003AEF3498
MKKKAARVISILLILVMSCTAFSFAHSGRTDSSGGHRDNKNVSGLGYYHYHCGGHPAHLHPNGVCPYSGSSSQKKPVKKYSRISKPTLSLKSVGANYIKVSWSKRSKAVRYNLYRSTSKYGSYKKIASTTKTYYNDKTVKNKTGYYYKVKAIAKASKYNSYYSTVKYGKINFNGKITLSKNNFDLRPDETAIVYVSTSGTSDDIIAYYNDDYIEIEWGDEDENGRLPLYIYSYASASEAGRKIKITLKFENHQRLYKKTLTVQLADYAAEDNAA